MISSCWSAAISLFMDLLAKFLLVELLSGHGSVCQRVDGVDHEVRLGVVLLLHPVTVAMGPDGFHDNLCPRYLVLDVAFQNAEDSKHRDFDSMRDI